MPEWKISAASIKRWRLYHGTSEALASRIGKQGGQPYLRQIGAESLGVELWRRMLRRYGDMNGAVTRLQDRGCEFTTSAAFALSNISGEMPAKNFEYGDFYATFGLVRAARFALRSKHGSELLGIFSDVIATLKSDGEDLGNLLSRFPELTALCNTASNPVVLEIARLSPDNIADKNGKPLTNESATALRRILEFTQSSKVISSAGTALDVRLRGVSPRNVRSVYRLIQLEPASVKSIRDIGPDREALVVAVQRCGCSLEEFMAHLAPNV